MSPKKLSKDVVESWPEIFEEVSLKVVPIQYLCSVHVKFKDKRIWNIEIKPRNRNENWQTIEQNIQEIVNNYKKHIESIDFKLDTDKIKRDITKQTNKFLKRRFK
jgi:hypothetical protein